MKRLILDIDDVIKDTSGIWKDVLNCHDYDGCIYNKDLDDEEKSDLLDIISNYRNIPYIEGALEGITKLKEYFYITLCSSYYFDEEFEAKKRLARELNLPLIGCGVLDKPYKSGIDMSGAIFVDDGIRNLVHSNAESTTLFVCEDTLKSEYNYDGIRVYSWEELLRVLIP